jgi:hypothetical protein
MPQRPVPEPSPLTAPYWAGCRRGELVIQQCAGCGARIHFPEPRCPHCAGHDLGYEPVSGRGVVHTFSVVHRSFVPGFGTPFAIAWIDLEEGVRAFGNVLGRTPWIGMRVRIAFTELPGFGPIPHWIPAEPEIA